MLDSYYSTKFFFDRFRGKAYTSSKTENLVSGTGGNFVPYPGHADNYVGYQGYAGGYGGQINFEDAFGSGRDARQKMERERKGIRYDEGEFSSRGYNDVERGQAPRMGSGVKGERELDLGPEALGNKTGVYHEGTGSTANLVNPPDEEDDDDDDDEDDYYPKDGKMGSRTASQSSIGMRDLSPTSNSPPLKNPPPAPSSSYKKKTGTFEEHI